MMRQRADSDSWTVVTDKHNSSRFKEEVDITSGIA